MLQDTAADIIGRRYQLHDQVGQGGMGAVYRTTDLLTGQEVALKRVGEIPEELSFSTSYNVNDFRLALAQEFKLLASLRHPHVIEVLDYGFDTERKPYFTMELLDNANTILEAGRKLPLDERVALLSQMLQALAYLHRRGILHRDLKPANVLVVDGVVKVLDFGLSVMRDRAAQDETTGGTTAGTLAYMAPEVLVGNPASERSDLYAVGMIGYELLAEAHPFGDGRDVGTLINHILYTVPDFDSLDIGLELAHILERLLQKAPEDRYENPQQVMGALNTAIGGGLPLETAATRESYLQAAGLVGRDPEVGQLSGALKKAVDGTGSAWLITGESGVGKSRLLDELRILSMVDGALVMRGHSVAEGRAPYQAWRPLLRWLPLLTELDEADAAMVHLLMPDAVAASGAAADQAVLDPNRVQARLLDLLRSALANAGQPVVIILEDLHWAGSESSSLLAQFIEVVADLPVLVLGSYRDDERPNLPSLLPKVPVIKLDRLDESSITRLSEAMLGEAGRQEQVVDLLRRETEGNVFFLIEVVRALAEEAGNLTNIGQMTLPESVFAGGVHRIIQRRLNRVPEEYSHLLRLAAIIGRQQDLALLREVDQESDLNEFLLECANAAVLDVEDGEWRFAHDKLRDGVLDDMSPEERKVLHGRVAEALESLYGSDERAAQLAHHWGSAGDVDREGLYVAQAAEQALRTGAYHEAVAFFERALSLLKLATMDERTSQARRIYLQHRQAEAYLGFGGYEQARTLYRDSLVIAEKQEDTAGMARTLSALGDVAYALSDTEAARRHYQDGLASFRTVNDRAGIARTLSSLGNIAYDQGDHDFAKQLYQQSLSIAREMGGQWGMAGTLSGTEAATDDVSEFLVERKRLQGLLERYTKQNDLTGQADMHYELGRVAYELGEYADAHEHLLHCLAIRTEMHGVSDMVNVLNRLGEVEVARGEHEEAGQYHIEALAVAVENGLEELLLGTLLDIALYRSARGEKGRALEILAVLLHMPGGLEGVEDEAERIAFELESELKPEVVESVWEKGKSVTLDDFIQQILRDRRAPQ